MPCGTTSHTENIGPSSVAYMSHGSLHEQYTFTLCVVIAELALQQWWLCQAHPKQHLLLFEALEKVFSRGLLFSQRRARGNAMAKGCRCRN